jgi:allantoinase
MCAGPAQLARLEHKGAIAPGKHADLVVFADDEPVEVTPGALRHRHPVTPYAGEVLRGAVRATYLRGKQIAERGRALATDQGAFV